MGLSTVKVHIIQHAPMYRLTFDESSNEGANHTAAGAAWTELSPLDDVMEALGRPAPSGYYLARSQLPGSQAGIVSCPAGKIGGKIRLVNWHNWSHTEARIVNECTCSSHFWIGALKFLPERVKIWTSTGIKNCAQCYQTDFSSTGHRLDRGSTLWWWKWY